MTEIKLDGPFKAGQVEAVARAICRHQCETMYLQRCKTQGCHSFKGQEAIAKAAIAALSALPTKVPEGWKPIETAPKMLTVLLFAVTDRDGETVRNWKMATGWFDEGQDRWHWDGYLLNDWGHQPTHWMPLPEPPPC